MNDLAEIDRPGPAATADWPGANCYIDAWLLLLRAWRLEPVAGLGVTVALDYEGDQFTFFKYLHEDLERLYGVIAGELSVWGSLEEQLALQARLGRTTLVEVDGYYLPDTRATSYGRQHTKTTIVVEMIDPAACRLSYFHNDGRYELDGIDYDGLFRRLPKQAVEEDLLPPYAEFVKRRWPPLQGAALFEAALDALRRHLRRRPEQNPVERYQADFPAHMQWLIAHPEKFHDYAFVTFRQLGSNFELLSAHLRWLGEQGLHHLDRPCAAAVAISATAKAMQFKAARIASRRRFDACEAMFETLRQEYNNLMHLLPRAVG